MRAIESCETKPEMLARRAILRDRVPLSSTPHWRPWGVWTV